jgi:pimeloyl-ACP methyl ester carboxylesterase
MTGGGAAIEELEIENARGQRLAASLHRPAPPRAGRGGVVLCHGMLSSRASPKHRALCEELARRGLLAMRFDFAGRGDSQGETAEITYDRHVEDLEAAVARLERETEEIGLVGSSMGAAVAILHAQRHRGVRCVAGIATVGRPDVVLGRFAGPGGIAAAASGLSVDGVFLGPGLVRSALATDVMGAAAALRCPLLLVHGALDDVVPIAQARELADAAADSRLEVIPDGDHLLHRADHQRFLERVVGEFAASHLGGAAA